MKFGQAFEEVKKGKGMRLPQWQPDVVIKAQFPDKHSKMTAHIFMLRVVLDVFRGKKQILNYLAMIGR